MGLRIVGLHMVSPGSDASYSRPVIGLWGHHDTHDHPAHVMIVYTICASAQYIPQDYFLSFLCSSAHMYHSCRDDSVKKLTSISGWQSPPILMWVPSTVDFHFCSEQILARPQPKAFIFVVLVLDGRNRFPTVCKTIA